MIIGQFWPFLSPWIRIPGSESGSTRPPEFGSNLEPDPKHCFFVPHCPVDLRAPWQVDNCQVWKQLVILIHRGHHRAGRPGTLLIQEKYRSYWTIILALLINLEKSKKTLCPKSLWRHWERMYNLLRQETWDSSWEIGERRSEIKEVRQRRQTGVRRHET